MYLMKDIIREGNPLLNKVCEKVSLPIKNEDLEVLKGLYEYVVASSIEELVKKYKIRPGVGIAAPQVGICKRMFAINFEDFLDNNKRYCFAVINPVITYKSKDMVYLPGGEGCLSVDRPTDDLITPRHYKITVKGFFYDFNTNSCKQKTMTLEGYPAIVFQHEYDHLDGILFTSKMYKNIPDCEPLFTIDDEDKDEK
ncbi:MAG: peptide deformylase [Anaeroplasmataceae bacterium]